ncbi:MAG: SdrD B-like domain-containing protein [Caldilineaceae bacterium]
MWIRTSIEEPLPASLSGSVYDDLNNNGVQDVAEPGIPGVTITLDDGQSQTTATTNATGYYEFTNLAPNTYTVTETDPNGYTSTGSEPGTVGSLVVDANTIQVILSAGEDSQENDFLDGQAPSSIGIEKILTGAGPFQPGDEVNFTIRITNTGSITITNLPLTDTYDIGYLTYDTVFDATSPNPATDATNDGSIYWANVINFDNDGQLDPNEVVNLTVTFIAKAATTSLAGGVECEPAGYTYNKARAAGQESCVEVQINPAPGKSTLGDFVWYDINGDGIKDAGEQGIDGVRVELYEVVDLGGGITETQFITFQITGPDRTGVDSDDTPTYGDAGAYDFQVLDNKTYQVVITDTNFLPGGALEHYIYVGDNASEPYSGLNPRTVAIGTQEDNNDADFPFTLMPSLQVTKVLNGVNPFGVGVNVSFTIRVTNTGSVTITTLPLEDRYSSVFLAYASATPAPDSAVEGVLTWNDLLTSLNDTDGLGVGESVSVDVTFTTEADTTLLSAVAPCTENGQAPNLARVMNAMADAMPVVPDADDSDCASVQILNPTGVQLAERSLTQTPDGVLVGWGMVEETNVVGFYVWHANGVESSRRSAMILTKVGGQQTGGVTYEWLDADATLTRGDAYVLEIVYTDGTSQRVIIDAVNGVSVYLPLIEK